MTWISLVCLLALASSAFGRSAYEGGYGGSSFSQTPTIMTDMREKTIPRPFLPTIPQRHEQKPLISELPTRIMQHDTRKIPTTFDSSFMTETLPKTLPTQTFGSMQRVFQFDQEPKPEVPIMTPADLLCRGQAAETVIPIENGRKFIVCLAEGKGTEQACPKGLFYHPTSRRCERRLGPFENLCASQPCLNGGECMPVDSHYKCRCAPGFDGINCELDARVCQTQHPCGQSPDARCQSFRLGAALDHICIFRDGLAYGLTAQQTVSTPCQDVDGPHALAVSKKGFIMCDGERMFIEACPGGTIWDDINKACVWPDMEGTIKPLDQSLSLRLPTSELRPLINKPTHISSLVTSQSDLRRPIHSLGVEITRPVFDERKPMFDERKPVFDERKPVFDERKPVFDERKPVFDERKPVFDERKPVFDERKPVFEESKRMFEESKPVFEFPKSGYEQSRPVSELRKPMFEEPKPVFELPKQDFEQPRRVFEQPKRVFEQQKFVEPSRY